MNALPRVLYRFPQCAGQKFQPSNGTEGMAFTEAFCERCVRDWKYQQTGNGDDGCQILMRTMLHRLADPEYPAEWVYSDEGWPVCTAFEPMTQTVAGNG